MTPPCWRKARKIRQKAANRAAERLLRFESSLPKERGSYNVKQANTLQDLFRRK
jgi:hypothetical protein